MKRHRQTMRRLVGGMATAAVLIGFAVFLPQWTQQGFGETLAVCSASLLQPEQSLSAFARGWEARPLSDTLPNGFVKTIALPATWNSPRPSEQRPPAGTVAAVIPPKLDGGGTVVEEEIGGGTALTPTVSYKNSSGFDRDFASLLDQTAGIRFADTEAPQVLIVHSHTTESYMTYYAGYYNDADCIRTPDTTRNMCVIGEVVANRLRASGIGVLHDTETHDYPQYTNAYNRSAEVVRRTLEQYPSIRLVLDLHRDALQRDAVTKVKPTVTVQGEKVAQMMLVVGASDTEDAPHPYWEINATLGLQLQHTLNQAYPGLMRPISFTESRYNQQLFAGFLLVEVGGDANTFAEAMVSARLLGDALVRILR